MYEVPPSLNRSSSSWSEHIRMSGGLLCLAITLLLPWDWAARFDPIVTRRGYEFRAGHLLLITLVSLLVVWVVDHTQPPWGRRTRHGLSILALVGLTIITLHLTRHIEQMGPIFLLFMGNYLIGSAFGQRLRLPE